jgi:hypothetical protein
MQWEDIQLLMMISMPVLNIKFLQVTNTWSGLIINALVRQIAATLMQFLEGLPTI